MWEWIFDYASLVDFLAFAFALNTMFSFDTIREFVFERLAKELKEKEEEIQEFKIVSEATREQQHLTNPACNTFFMNSQTQ